MLEKKQLPIDVLRFIFSYLTPLEILALSQTSKQLRKMSDDNWLWFHKLNIHFPHALYRIKGKVSRINCKAVFKHFYRTEYKNLSPTQRHIFTLVKEGQVDKLQKQSITTESLVTIKDSKGLNLIFWASKNQNTLDYFYNLIVTEAKNRSQVQSQNPLHQDKFGYGLLHYMIMCNQIESLKILRASGVNINTTSQSSMKYNGLHLAAKLGHIEIVKMLIKANPAQINSRDIHGQSAVSWASDYGHDIIVRELLVNGADPNIANNSNTSCHGISPIHCATSMGHISIVKSLITYGANINAAVSDDGMKPIHIAASHGISELVKHYIKHDPNCINVKNKYDETALIYAARNGHTDIVEYLLDKKSDIECFTNKPGTNIHGRTALYWATVYGHKAVVTLLLRHDAKYHNKMNDMSLQPIHHAAFKGNLSILHALVKHDPSCLSAKNQYDETALIYAARNGQTDIVEYLLDKKANAECFSNSPGHKDHGKTALCWAVEYAHEEVVKCLIQHGANTRAAYNKGGEQPLHIATRKGHYNIVKLLTQHDQRLLKEKNSMELTAFDIAFSQKDAEAVGLLISLGAPTYIQTWLNRKIYYTHDSINKNDRKMLEGIIKHNPKLIEECNDNHYTPLAHAIMQDKSDIAEYLIRNGANIHFKIHRSWFFVDDVLTLKQYTFESKKTDILVSMIARELQQKNVQTVFSANYEARYRIKKMDKVRDLLASLNFHMMILNHRKCYKAEECAKKLIRHIRDDAITYLSNPDSDALIEFQSKCLDHINNATPELLKHRGWKRLLGNLMIAVLTLGTAFLINKIVTGNFLFFHQTRSSELLEHAITVLGELTPQRRIPCEDGIIVRTLLR